MKLVRFTGEGDLAVWVNPADVVSVVACNLNEEGEVVEPYTLISFRQDDDGLEVYESADDVARELMQKQERF